MEVNNTRWWWVMFTTPRVFVCWRERTWAGFWCYRALQQYIVEIALCVLACHVPLQCQACHRRVMSVRLFLPWFISWCVLIGWRRLSVVDPDGRPSKNETECDIFLPADTLCCYCYMMPARS